MEYGSYNQKSKRCVQDKVDNGLMKKYWICSFQFRPWAASFAGSFIPPFFSRKAQLKIIVLLWRTEKCFQCFKINDCYLEDKGITCRKYVSKKEQNGIVASSWIQRIIQAAIGNLLNFHSTFISEQSLISSPTGIFHYYTWCPSF